MDSISNWSENVRKHLKRGDLIDIAGSLKVSDSLVAKVLAGHTTNIEVMEALITKAEIRKKEKLGLLKRAESL